MKFQSISTTTKIYRQKALWRSVMWQKRNLRQCRIFSNWDQSDRLRCSLPSKYIFDPLPSLSDYLVAEFSTMQQPTKSERLQLDDGARLFHLYWKLISQIANWEDSTKNSFHLYRNISMLFVSRSFTIYLVTTVMGQLMEPVYLHWQNIKTILNS